MKRIQVWAATLLLVPSLAHSYSISLLDGDSGNIVRWHTSTLQFRLHPSGSADVVDGSDLDAVRASFQQWNGVSCSALQMVEGPSATTLNHLAVGGPANGSNEVTWAEGSEWIYGQFVLGLTSTSFQVPSGEIVESDIAFNGYQNKWSTTGKAGTVDVMNVATHELGHAFGAQHVLAGYDTNDPPTMAPKADPFLKSQTIEEDDALCACFLYPLGEYNCTQDADCPAVVDDDAFGKEYYVGQIGCSGGLCGGTSAMIPQGTQTLGEACASDIDCVDPLFCQPTGGGSSVCAKNCNVDADCGSGFKCFPYSNSSGGVCLPFEDSGGTSGPTKENGEQCNGAQECKSGLCVGSFGTSAYYCRAVCTVGGSCPAGESCSQLQGTSQGACLPDQGGVATKPPGEVCASPSECISGLCVGSAAGSYKCRESCSPTLNDCPVEHTCFGLSGSGGGACIPTGPKKELGEACESSSDCDTDYCLGIQGEAGAFCSRACGGAAGDCPCGMLCTEFAGGESFCTPGGPTACVPSGNPCESAEVCISQTCIAGTCKDPCQLQTGGCPPGQSCRRLKTGSLNGVCEVQGGAALGAECASDSACQSNLCELGTCALPCEVGVTFCGTDAVCWQPEGTTVSVCAPPPEGTDGVDAADGGTGTDAVDGFTGADGTTAADGTDGADGTSADGTDGLTGLTGTGSSGSSGGSGGSSGCSATGSPGPGSAPWAVLFALGLFLLATAGGYRRSTPKPASSSHVGAPPIGQSKLNPPEPAASTVRYPA